MKDKLLCHLQWRFTEVGKCSIGGSLTQRWHSGGKWFDSGIYWKSASTYWRNSHHHMELIKIKNGKKKKKSHKTKMREQKGACLSCMGEMGDKRNRSQILGAWGLMKREILQSNKIQRESKTTPLIISTAHECLPGFTSTTIHGIVTPQSHCRALQYYYSIPDYTSTPCIYRTSIWVYGIGPMSSSDWVISPTLFVESLITSFFCK